MKVAVEVLKVKSTGEILVTDEVDHPRFWGRHILADEKCEMLELGVLTVNDVSEIADEEPLVMAALDDNAKVVMRARASRVIKRPGRQQLTVLKQNRHTEKPLLSPEINFDNSKQGNEEDKSKEKPLTSPNWN